MEYFGEAATENSRRPSQPGYIRAFASELSQGLRHHAILYLGGATVFLSGQIVSTSTGYLITVSPANFVFTYVLLAGALVFIAIFLLKFLHMAIVDRTERPGAELLRWLRYDLLSSARLANGVHGMIFLFLLMAGFSMWKNQISRFGGFRLDELFSNLDRYLHLGSYPHDILQVVVGYPWVTTLIDIGYVTWFPALFAACFTVAFQPLRSFHRHRFLLAFLLTWGVGGTLIATLLASAGPVYYAQVTGLADPYLAHFQYLGDVNQARPLQALQLQNRLWLNYTGKSSLSIISAMPSMHCAVATLIFLGCRSQGVFAAWIGGLFAVLILVGSIHLGWHYAIDSYLGAALALAAWKIALPVTRWHLGQAAGQ